MRVVVLAALLIVMGTAHAEDDPANRTIIFARGDKLIKADGRGRNESELATLPAKAQVRA